MNAAVLFFISLNELSANMWYCSLEILYWKSMVFYVAILHTFI